MNGLLVTATVAPLLVAPSVRSEQASQLVLGEGAVVLAAQGSMLHVRTMLDQYEGWIAAGYVTPLPAAEVEAWLADAAWSEGAVLRTPDGVTLRAPHRARLRRDAGCGFQLPSGTCCDIIAGRVRPWPAIIADARCEEPAVLAWREFAGTPYLWGGVTGAGIDCSGLVQNVFLARGVVLPRDARQQVAHGVVVDANRRQAGDLLFFRAPDSDQIGHVGILDHDDWMVHSAIDTGGVTRESLTPGSLAHALMARLVAVRRVA